MSIINFISSWLKDIVSLFILISIAELIMPKGNMKKYIDLVIGLLVIFTIISPFVKLLKMNFNLSEAVYNYSKPENYLNISNEDFYIQQEEQIESVYKEKIKTELTNLIQEESIYQVVDISIDLMKEIELYGDIEYLNIIITKDNIEEDKISVKKVDEIEINKKSDKAVVDDENKYKELKEIIEAKYSVSNEKINIFEYEKGKGGVR